MLDKDLADLYGVQTSRLNEAVKRNIKRFPDDFMFQLTDKEAKNLMSQFAISSWGGYRKLPYAFTEQGIAMLSSVLSSERAIEMNILIMRAFVKLRRILTTHKGLAQKIEELEKKYSKHEIEISVVFKLLKQLMGSSVVPEKPKKRIGFLVD